MKNILFLILLSLCISTLSLPGFAQEFPFIYFQNRIIASGEEVLAFHQNTAKEIQFVTKEGVFSFNGKRTEKIFDFSREQLAEISQAVFTSNKLFVLSSGNIFAIGLKTDGEASLQKGKADKIFYHQEQDQLYLFAKGSLEMLKDNDQSQKVLEGLNTVGFLYFGEKENILVGKSSISIYSPTWEFLQKVDAGEAIIDSYFSNERLLLLTSASFFSWEMEAGLKKYPLPGQDEPVCILEDQTGKIWMGTKNKGILLYDGNHYQQLAQKNMFPLQEVKGIYQSPDLSLWFYGDKGMALKPFSAPFLKFKLGEHLSGKVLHDIKVLGPHQVAVLSREGNLHLLENETMKDTFDILLPFKPLLSKILGEQESIHVSEQGDILLNYKQKVSRHSLKKEVKQLFTFQRQSLIFTREGKIYSLDHKSRGISKINWGLLINGSIVQAGNSLIYKDDKGKFKRWDSEKNVHETIGESIDVSFGFGIYKHDYLLYLQGQQLKFIYKDKVGQLDFSLGENETATQLFISENNLWISTEDDLYQFGLSLEDDHINLLEARIFKAEDYDIQLPVLQVLENEEGSFWLASKNNLYLYNSLALAPDVSPPGFVLEQISIQNNDSLAILNFARKDSVRINLYGNEQLLINAFAINYESKNKAFLRYRFPLSEKNWKDPVQEGLILLSGLAPGNHLVEIASLNRQGVRSNRSTFLNIEVSQEGWNKWFMVIGASLSFVLVGFVAYIGIRSGKDGKSRDAKEKYEKELLKLQRRSHEQMMKAEGLKQVNELISAQKGELEDKNKQILAQKYELSLTNNQIKKQKDLIEKTTEKLQSSINYAQRIQSALMGDEILIKKDLPESFVFFKPRDQVSGDFFWFEKTKNEQGEEILIIAAVDCTGHGVPGAIVSVVGIQLLNAIVKAKGITDPGKILTELNADLLESLKYEQTTINDGMDMTLCSLNLQQNKLYFAGAKNPLYYVEEGEFKIIKGDRIPIGGQKLREDKVFHTHEVALKGNGQQMFYLFTDGYQDQFGGPDQFKFLVKNFKELLKTNSGKSMMEQKYILGKTFKDWQGDEDQTDDILVMGFRI